ncbi:elongator complex protein 4 isoform X8 [Cavia porcellus]|uniref:elongator complex protein 4 isoform X8 n=1 Tax=Cavia porcellus TaxID=10141 RepID=UPI002FE0E024
MAAVSTCGPGPGNRGSEAVAVDRSSATSFQRRGPRAGGTDGSGLRLVSIAGTRPSVRNGQLLVSTGLPALDQLLGGGLAVGTVLLIEEDKYNVYSPLLFKSFLAEGVVNGHTLLVASAKEHPADTVQELPAPLLDDSYKKEFDEDGCNDKTPDSHMKMKIAWRYQLLPKMEQVGPVLSSRFGHYYDVSKKIPQELLQTAKWHGFFLPDNMPSPLALEPGHLTHGYTMLLEFIKKVISEEGVDGSNPQSKAITARVTNLSDTVVGLESFAGSERETNPFYKDYHGLMHIRQIPRLNNLICDESDVKDLAFKLKRKLFTIESYRLRVPRSKLRNPGPHCTMGADGYRLHLPPDLSDAASRWCAQDPARATPPLGPGCSGLARGEKHLDF